MAVNKFMWKVCYKYLVNFVGGCIGMGRNIREVGGDANLLSLNFYVLLALCSQLSVRLNLCISNALLHFCYVCHAVVSEMYPWVAPMV